MAGGETSADLNSVMRKPELDVDGVVQDPLTEQKILSNFVEVLLIRTRLCSTIPFLPNELRAGEASVELLVCST